ncbi:hypothetical protein [Geodermatophilus sp. URMC 64]
MTSSDDGGPRTGDAGKKAAVTKTLPPTTGPAPDGARTRRRGLLLAGAAFVLAAALVALLLVVNRGNGTAEAADGAAAASTTASRDAEVVPNPPTPIPTGPTENVDELPAALPEVALDSPAAVGNGVVATLTGIEAIQGTANGPGNIAGPAIRVTVHVENGTADPITLAGAAVNMYYGADKTPASPLDDPSQRPFGVDMVDPGESADGVYVFTVPSDARDAVTVEVGYQAGAPLLLFAGPVR